MSRLLLPLFAAACSLGAADGGPMIESATVQAMDAVKLQHTPVVVDRELLITGHGFQGTAQGPWVTIGGVESPSVRIRDSHTVVALVPADVHGTQTVRLENPDHRIAELTVDLH